MNHVGRDEGLAKCFLKELSRIIVSLNVRSAKSFKLYYIFKASMCSGYHTDTLNALTDKQKKKSLAMLPSLLFSPIHM